MDLKKALYDQGRAAALALQEKAPELTGTQLYLAADAIPDFSSAVKTNMLKRSPGFVCRTAAGRMARLLQRYDSEVYPQEPEDLPAQWGFAWSQQPQDALPFVQSSTSPYGKGEVCTWEGSVFRSLADGNIHSPGADPQAWEAVL